MRSILSRPTPGNLLVVCAASWLLAACYEDSSGDGEASEPCEYVEDGECDEPKGTGLCGEGTDRVDCSGAVIARCRFSNDGVCDEPEGTGDCAEGSDTNDCRGQIAACPFTNDGFCDEPEGTGDCADGTDANDCRGQIAGCPFANDGICDEPEGTGDCSDGTDPSDCSNVPTACAFTNNGVCDESEGTNRCLEGTDFTDCSAAGGCAFTNNGVCNEPEGTGACPEGTDSADCTRVVCGAVACDQIDFGLSLPGGLSTSCCAPSGGCGYSSGNGVCTELFEPQPGICPDYDLAASLPLSGCCLPSGMCGLVFMGGSIDYCVEIDANSSSPLAPFLPTTTVPCEGLDSDAGVD